MTATSPISPRSAMQLTKKWPSDLSVTHIGSVNIVIESWREIGVHLQHTHVENGSVHAVRSMFLM